MSGQSSLFDALRERPRQVPVATTLGMLRDAEECLKAGDVAAGARWLRSAIEHEEERREALSDPDARHLGPFVRDSETSRRAAIAAYPKAGTARWRILGALRRADATRDELAGQLGMSPNTVRPRVVELMQGGWVVDTGRTRKTVAGLDAEVLALSERAVARMYSTGGGGA